MQKCNLEAHSLSLQYVRLRISILLDRIFGKDIQASAEEQRRMLDSLSIMYIDRSDLLPEYTNDDDDYTPLGILYRNLEPNQK